jgi:cytochrome c oxidase subunit 4
MHTDTAAVKRSVRQYIVVFVSLMVFTVITVAVSGLNLGVPLAITVALIIAAIKGSMVAGVFMHLSHEKQWIYGALLLTVLFFIVLIFVPLFTVSDTFGVAVPAVGGAGPAAGIGH